MIFIFGCDDEERAEFQNAAEHMALSIRTFSSDINEVDIACLPFGAVVSVNHKVLINIAVIDALYQRGVRYINTRSIGMNHIDMEYAKKRGIAVENITYSPESVAEHAVMLMLMAVRKIMPTLERSAQGDYRLSPSRVNTLSGMTIGIIGTGKIGGSVSKMLQGFGCKLIAYSHTPTTGIHYTTLNRLLRESDIVTLHLPLCEETTHFMSWSRISLMKPGAILVNVSRGGLIDTEALESALKEGRIAGAALDVIEGEENYFYQNCIGKQNSAPFYALESLPNVILTPHCAFFTKQALSDIVTNTLRNCMEYERRTKNESTQCLSIVRRNG